MDSTTKSKYDKVLKTLTCRVCEVEKVQVDASCGAVTCYRCAMNNGSVLLDPPTDCSPDAAGSNEQ